MNKEKILVISNSLSKQEEFYFLKKYFKKVDFLKFNSPHFLFFQLPISTKNLEEVFSIASQIVKKDYSCVITRNTPGFLWATILRLKGMKSPFIIYAHYNPCYFINVVAVILFSQVAIPYDIVITGSSTSANLFKLFGLNSTNLCFFGVDLDSFYNKYNKIEARNFFQLPVDKKIILFTGRGDEDKNIDLLIEIFLKINNLLPKTALVVSTIFDNEIYMNKCKEIAKNNKNIYFFQNIFGENLVKLYCAADLFVTLAISPFETFGRSPAEALACRVPVIVPLYDGFREVVPVDCGYHISVKTMSLKKEKDSLRSFYESPNTILKKLKKINKKEIINTIIEALTNQEKTLWYTENAYEHIRKFEKHKCNYEFVTFIKDRVFQLYKTDVLEEKINFEKYLNLKNLFEKWFDNKTVKEILFELLIKGLFVCIPDKEKKEYFEICFKEF
jgi:glycosyltransferase involved in cell wall biosynthesis